MATRPTTNQTWAENADADDISEPAVERPRGYLFEEDLPNGQLNWLLRELFRWAAYFDDKFNGAQEQIEFFSDIEFNAGSATQYGDFTEEQNDTSFYKVEQQHTGSGDAYWVSDYLEAIDRLITPILESESAGALIEVLDGAQAAGGFDLDFLRPTNDDEIEVESSGGASGAGGFLLDALRSGVDEYISIFDSAGGSADGGFLLSFLEAPSGLLSIRDGGVDGQGGLELDSLRPGIADQIDVESSAGVSGGGEFLLEALQAGTDLIDFIGSGGVSGVGGAILGTLQTGNSNDIIDVDDGAGNTRDGGIYGRNTVRAWARISVVDATATVVSQYGFETENVVVRDADGQFTMTLDQPAALTNDLCIVVSTYGNSGVINFAKVLTTDVDEFEVYTYQEIVDSDGSGTPDAFTLKDGSFMVHVTYGSDG